MDVQRKCRCEESCRRFYYHPFLGNFLLVIVEYMGNRVLQRQELERYLIAEWGRWIEGYIGCVGVEYEKTTVNQQRILEAKKLLKDNSFNV